MKRCIFALVLLYGCALSCTENEPLAIEIGAGYGQQNCKWKSFSNTEPRILHYQETYRKIRMAETIASLRSVQYDFYFLLEGGFGYPFAPHMKEHMVFDDEDIHFLCKSKGYEAHSLFLFGYEVNLTPDHFSHFFVTPLVGYAGFWKNLHVKNRQIDTFTTGAIEQEHNTLKQTWYGPCLGGGIFVVPDNFWRLELSYLFDWLDLRHSSHTIFNSSSPLGEELLSTREKEKKLSGYGHLVRGKIFYHISSKWKTSFQADYHYFASHDGLISTRTRSELISSPAMTTVTQSQDRLHASEYLLSFLLEIAWIF